jgi:WD40 repeat protein
MTNRSLQHLLKLSVVIPAAVLALSARADLRAHADDDRRGAHADDDRRGEHADHDRRRDRDDDDRQDRRGLRRLATGQYITPRFLEGALLQYLNPGLTGYPDFVAGEAVRSQLSPDGTTLAIITAGQNSLYKPDGTVDTANSTQFIFLYNVAGANKASPVLSQVIQQVNAHVGLVFSPDGNTLYAAGGNDDAVYVYTRSGGRFTAATPIALGHFAPGATGIARNKGVGLSVEPNASGIGISADGNTLVVANNYNDSISVIDTATRSIRYEHDLRPFFANNEGTQQINYAFVDRGLSYESEGANRNVPVNYATVAERDAVAGVAGTTNYSIASAGLPGGTVNLLPGTGNHASSDAPFGIQDGYIFNALLQAGGTVRDYGFLVNNIGSIGSKTAPVSDPFASGIIQVGPLNPALASLTDVYFRGFDQNYPDLWRYNEWKREFDQFVASGKLPSLSLVRISHDHMGSFGTALAGVNTPETQQADCDLALGLLVQAVANSRYAADTLIIVTEDDVQDGPDHVDSHRGPAFVVGPYVKQGAVVSTRYSQVNALRTIEDVLGTQHINLNTAFQRPMADVFDIGSSGAWTYAAEASNVLATTTLALAGGDSGVRFAAGPNIKPKHNAAYWDKVTAGFDFSEADQVPTARFNRVLWTGLMGRKPYPALRGQATGTKDDDDR